MNLYGDDFYRVRDEETRNAAKTVLSILNEIFSINSMVDVGCGVGTWLNEFYKIKKGQCNIVGIDGNYVNRDLLTIKEERFLPMDLESQINLSEKFDLAISLEVAEHLSIERAEGFVNDLTKLSPVILFSAAFPNQGGVGHINERPMSYWVELFQEQGYEKYDIIRPVIHNDKNIPWWYRNNTICYVEAETAKNNHILCEYQRWDIPDMVLEEIFQGYYNALSQEVEEKSIKGRLKKAFFKSSKCIKGGG